MQPTDVRSIVQAYQEALEARDVDHCVSFYTEDAIIHFGPGVYRGKEAIESWHRDRFAANLRILRLQEVQVDSNRAVYNVEVESDKLRAWRINTLQARAIVTLQDGRIKELKFSVRLNGIFEGW